MVRKLILPILAAALSLVLAASLAAQGEKSDTNQPQVSGTMQGNVGCAVLEKHTPVKGKLLALGVIYARTEYRARNTRCWRRSMPPCLEINLQGRGRLRISTISPSKTK
jgi:hypothetical protein